MCTEHWVKENHRKTSCYSQVIALFIPSWRSLHPLQGSLHHHKKVTLNHQVNVIFFSTFIAFSLNWGLFFKERVFLAASTQLYDKGSHTLELLKPNLSQEGGNCNNSTPSSSRSLYLKEPGFESSYSLPDIFGCLGAKRSKYIGNWKIWDRYFSLDTHWQLLTWQALHQLGLKEDGSKRPEAHEIVTGKSGAWQSTYYWK